MPKNELDKRERESREIEFRNFHQLENILHREKLIDNVGTLSHIIVKNGDNKLVGSEEKTTEFSHSYGPAICLHITHGEGKSGFIEGEYSIFSSRFIPTDWMGNPIGMINYNKPIEKKGFIFLNSLNEALLMRDRIRETDLDEILELKEKYYERARKDKYWSCFPHCYYDDIQGDICEVMKRNDIDSANFKELFSTKNAVALNYSLTDYLDSLLFLKMIEDYAKGKRRDVPDRRTSDKFWNNKGDKFWNEWGLRAIGVSSDDSGKKYFGPIDIPKKFVKAEVRVKDIDLSGEGKLIIYD